MSKQTKLKKVSSQKDISPHEIIKLLLADHKLLRDLMKKIKSQKATPKQVKKSFKELKAQVKSHVTAEEKTFLDIVKDHPSFKDHVLESREEHRVHEYVFDGIKRVKDPERKAEQMKIYCEMLEHHLDEEEEDLFPRFKKTFATSTNKKAAVNYSEVRKETNPSAKKRGATRFKTK